MAIEVKTLTTGEKLFYVGQTDQFLGWEDLRYATNHDGEAVENKIIEKITSASNVLPALQTFVDCKTVIIDFIDNYNDDGGGVIMLPSETSEAFANVLAEIFGDVICSTCGQPL